MSLRSRRQWKGHWYGVRRQRSKFPSSTSVTISKTSYIRALIVVFGISAKATAQGSYENEQSKNHLPKGTTKNPHHKFTLRQGIEKSSKKLAAAEVSFTGRAIKWIIKKKRQIYLFSYGSTKRQSFWGKKGQSTKQCIYYDSNNEVKIGGRECL